MLIIMTTSLPLKIPSIYFHHRSYLISFDPSLDHMELSDSKKLFFQEIHTKTQEDPGKHLPILEGFYAEHKNIPELANLLSFAYLQVKKIKQAEELIRTTYEMHPNYICAKINYADQCLRYKKIGEIPAIFNNKRDLLEIYPERFSYHYSQFRGFMVVMGFYLLACKDYVYADKHLGVAEEIDPWHPGVIALKKASQKKPWRFFSRR